MSRSRFCLQLIGVVLACCAAPTYFRARPPIHCDLPNRDYVYKAFSPPVTATSLIAVPFEVIPTVAVSPPTAAATPMVSVPPSAVVFQFSDPPLTIHHCSISNIAVQLDKNGRCVVSLQANQNPLTISLLQATPAVTTKEPLLSTLQCCNEISSTYGSCFTPIGWSRTGDGSGKACCGAVRCSAILGRTRPAVSAALRVRDMWFETLHESGV